MKTEHECIDLKCTYWDGDRCTLGFCEPDTLDDEPSYKRRDREYWEDIEPTDEEITRGLVEHYISYNEITRRVIREFATWKGHNNILGISVTPESVQFGLEEVEDWLDERGRAEYGIPT